MLQEITYEQYKKLEELPEVEEMPFYPDDGSIKIIEDIIVVKFGSKQ
ncbi:MAG: hypothetical protein HFI39_04680 [Lachnospiraceae bacterium]|nr:hypothetical protein [Lachnospiraceae bacterium]